ncbi:MAG: HDOD domain-containing protein [Pseudomonadota bacterium]
MSNATRPLGSVSSIPKTVGRFQLRRLLGEGAQSTVWLAHDPRLQREVAIKLMRPAVLDSTGGVDQWLSEARHVSQLNHPHIVPVYEADMHEDQPYLVFEYVPGRTLSQHLIARGALPAHEAVALMLGILDALAAAHAMGIVHRDLKPSNVLVDGTGRARVMDFGIAVHVKDGAGAGDIVGTPGYISPEAAQGLPPTPRMDVFSAGAVLAELVSARRLMVETDAHRALHRVVHEDMVLPDNLGADVDDRLRALIMRAVARDGEVRFADAMELGEALALWAQAGTGSAPASDGLSGTLAFLLRRLRHKTDFPALSDSVARIQRVVDSENESLASLTTEILKDVALTNKLLRLVNTVHFTRAGGGSISTVSRAVALVGFSGIRNLALSLVLLDHMHDKDHAGLLLDEFLGALMAASLASALMPSTQHGEEAFIGGMFHNLGRLLTAYYFPEEAQQVRNILATATQPQNEEAVAVGVLGLSFESLGLGIAKSWALPDVLQHCMRKHAGGPPAKPPTAIEDRLHWAVLAGSEMADLLRHTRPQQLPSRMQAVSQRYGRVLGLSSAEIQTASVQARLKLAQMVQAMNISVSADSPAGRWLALPAPEEESAAPLVPADELPRTDPMTITQVMAAPRPQAVEMLLAGIQDITNGMVENVKLNEVLRMILETMIRALKFQRVIFCLRDAKLDALTGRFGLGDNAQNMAKTFKVPLTPARDLFHAVCMKGTDTLISDATAANIARSLPAWYVKEVNAPSFLLLPLHTKGSPFALIYADMPTTGGLTLDEKELSLLRTLRNQAVLAFMQSA